MVNADLGATKPGEERVRLVRAGAVQAVRHGMVDAMHLIVSVQVIPAARLIRKRHQEEWRLVSRYPGVIPADLMIAAAAGLFR